jgi:hypothetical protein
MMQAVQNGAICMGSPSAGWVQGRHGLRLHPGEIEDDACHQSTRSGRAEGAAFDLARDRRIMAQAPPNRPAQTKKRASLGLIIYDHQA